MRLVWTREALADREAIWLYRADYSIAVADRIEQRVVQRAESLATFPYLGRPLPDTSERELSIPDIQHVIAYEVDDGEVRVLRIRHTAQDRT